MQQQQRHSPPLSERPKWGVASNGESVILHTRWRIDKGEAISHIQPGDEDFDPDVMDGQSYDAAYLSFGVWDEVTQDWAGVGTSDDASHFDTYPEAVRWINVHLRELAASGNLESILIKE